MRFGGAWPQKMIFKVSFLQAYFTKFPRLFFKLASLLANRSSYYFGGNFLTNASQRAIQLCRPFSVVSASGST